MPDLLDEMACFVLKMLTSEIPCYAETATCADLLRSETAAVRSTLLDAETARWDDLPCAETADVRIHCSTPKPQHARICSAGAADIRSTLLYAETATCEDLLRSETDDAR